jgi:hypothetical protein
VFVGQVLIVVEIEIVPHVVSLYPRCWAPIG